MPITESNPGLRYFATGTTFPRKMALFINLHAPSSVVAAGARERDEYGSVWSRASGITYFRILLLHVHVSSTHLCFQVDKINTLPHLSHLDLLRGVIDVSRCENNDLGGIYLQFF